ncbi:MAG: hypothetical protein IH989_05995 [Planctomycetes bacterium]|nr:hypothetical protein [Planctomycetota bacterium]
MLKTFWRTFCIAGLTLSAGAWAGTYWLAATRSPHATCVTFGYSRPDKWLVNAMIYPDGFVLVRRFSPNLSYRVGLYGKTSDANASHALSLRSLRPASLRRPPRGVSGFLFHLSLPITVFVGLAGQSVAYPIWRRRRRHKRGLCLACGYDMRGATSTTCTECGRVNDHITEVSSDPSSDSPVGDSES